MLLPAGDTPATLPPEEPAPAAVLNESRNAATAQEVFISQVAELNTDGRALERVACTSTTVVLPEDFDDRYGGQDATEVTCYVATGETLWEAVMLVLPAISSGEVRYTIRSHPADTDYPVGVVDIAG